MDEPRLSLEVLEPAKDESGTARAPCLVDVGPAALLAWPLVLVLQGGDDLSGAGLRTRMQLALLLVPPGLAQVCIKTYGRAGIGNATQGWPGSWFQFRTGCRA